MSVSTTPARVQRRLRARSGHLLRIAVLVSLLGGLLAVLPVAASSAATPVPDVSHDVDPSNGFPLWYQDSSGVRLAPCLDIADSNCVLAGDASYDPAKPLAFPTNFPEEFFYAQAQSTRLTTPGCKGTKPGRIDITVALEGAFTNGAPAYGDQMVFGRTRLTVAGGLCAGSTYHAVYPYGELDFTTDSNGALAKTAGTTDVGCAPIAPNACDFRLALTSKVATSFLRWDPAVAPQAPDGYLGDATIAHRVTGATFTPAGASAPANYFEVTGPRLDQPLRTDTFTVSGKKAGPLAATPARVDFAGHEAGTTSDPRDVTVRSWATADVHPTAARVEGPDAGSFGIVSDECAAATLVQDSGHCRVSVDFRPAATAHGPLSARLVVGHDAYGQPLSVPLSGTATGGDEAPGHHDVRVLRRLRRAADQLLEHLADGHGHQRRHRAARGVRRRGHRRRRRRVLLDQPLHGVRRPRRHLHRDRDASRRRPPVTTPPRCALTSNAGIVAVRHRAHRPRLRWPRRRLRDGGARRLPDLVPGRAGRPARAVHRPRRPELHRAAGRHLHRGGRHQLPGQLPGRVLLGAHRLRRR